MVRAYLGRSAELQARIGYGTLGQNRDDGKRIEKRLYRRTAPQLAYPRSAATIKGPRAQPILVHQITCAGEQSHLEQVAPTESCFYQFLPVFLCIQDIFQICHFSPPGRRLPDSGETFMRTGVTSLFSRQWKQPGLYASRSGPDGGTSPKSSKVRSFLSALR